MLTYREIIELKDKLVSGEIKIEFAKKKYWIDWKEGQRSWETKDWKERRAAWIKDKCEICNGEETLTIQHRSHPKTYAEYEREITRAYAKEHITTNPGVDISSLHTYILQHYEYLPVPLCTHCKSSSIKERVRKLPKYRCADCHHESDTTTHKTMEELISIFHEDEYTFEVRDKCFVSKDKYRNKHNLSNIKYWMQRNSVKTKDSLAIEKEAFLLYLNDCIKYLSFEDAITACKKCAYQYDIQNMELCPTCKQNYKGIQYPTCIPCLPEEKRLAALQTIEFAKEREQMHKDLGID